MELVEKLVVSNRSELHCDIDTRLLLGFSRGELYTLGQPAFLVAMILGGSYLFSCFSR